MLLSTFTVIAMIVAHLPRSARNSTFDMSVPHVVDVTQQLQFIIHCRDDGIQTVSNKSHLFVVFSVSFQRINGDISEFGEVFLDARSLLEETFMVNGKKC